MSGAAHLSDHRRRKLQEAAVIARGAVTALEQGAKGDDPDALAVAGAALQDAGKLAARYARQLAGIERAEPARQLSPKGGPRRAA